MIDPIPTGKWARSSVAGQALIKAGGTQLKHMVKRPFLSEQGKKANREQRDDQQAQLLFKTFTQLRGTALKIAQMLSMETSLLPEAFRIELSKSYHQVPPLGRALVRKQILQAFGLPPEKVFTEFTPEAFAAASLGQVHTATNDNRKALAVKIQYPGIDVTIDNDMQLLRAMLKRSRYADRLALPLDEIEQRLREEVDYHNEADNTEWFAKQLKLDGVIIPTVDRQRSARCVLSTEKLYGLHLDEWLQTQPSQASRNQAAQKLMDTFVHSFYRLHALHADPNPGNYLFIHNPAEEETGASPHSRRANQKEQHDQAANGIQLGLIDFGCVRYFSAAFVDLMPQLMRAYREQDQQGVMEAYYQLGMVADMSDPELDEFYQGVLQPFGDWVTEPFKVEAFDFSQRQRPYSEQGLAFINELAKLNPFSQIAREFIYFDRTFLGLYQIFERLGATVRMQHPWLI